MDHGLLHVHVLSLPHGVQSDAGMPVVGSSDNHGVDIGHGNSLAIVQEAFGFEAIGGGSLTLLVDVAHRDNLAGVTVLLCELGEGLAVGVAASAASN